MLTDDLIASLNAHAADVEQPPADLLSRVEKHAQRQQRMRYAILASVSLIALVAGGTGLSLLRRSASVTRTIGRAGVIAPAPCDEPGATRPQSYLDWPCVSAVDDTTAARVASLETGLRRGSYAGIGDLQVRLLADSRHDGDTDVGESSSDTMIEAWFAGSTRPAVIADLFGDRTELDSAGLSAAAAPAGDPAIAFQPSSGDTQRRVFTRSDVATLVLARTDGTSTTTPDGGVATLHYPPLQGDGMEPGWRIIALARDGRTLADVPFDTTPDPPARAASPAPAASRDLCEDPVAYGQKTYLDWPCATPADSHTEERVDTALAELAKSYPSIKNPHVRLLADTAGLGSPDLGPAATEMEVWDPADTRSAVLDTYDAGHADTAEVLFKNDPGIVVASSTTISGENLVFARPDVATIAFHHGAVDERVTMHGGVGVVHPPTPELYQGFQTWTVIGFDSAGHEVAETPFAVDGCAVAEATPCNPLATPAFGH